jgi:hypothetical protein
MYDARLLPKLKNKITYLLDGYCTGVRLFVLCNVFWVDSQCSNSYWGRLKSCWIRVYYFWGTDSLLHGLTILRHCNEVLVSLKLWYLLYSRVFTFYHGIKVVQVTNVSVETIASVLSFVEIFPKRRQLLWLWLVERILIWSERWFSKGDKRLLGYSTCSLVVADWRLSS